MGEREFYQAKELELLNKGPWELRDQPISSNVVESYLDPFSGEVTHTYKRDPRHKALRELIENYNDSNLERAGEVIRNNNSRYTNVVVLPRWDMLPMDRSKGDVAFVQEPCAYIDMYNSFDHIDERKYVYRGKTRKGFKGKVFIIKEKGKTFYKVQDITSGKRYKFWPEDLEEVDSLYIIDWSHAKAED